MSAATNIDVIEVKAGESLYCPNKKMALWSSHPKVYLSPDEHGNAKCSYCGTRYHQEGGKSGH
jgi:uncharacterized Zn-finger protein